MPRTFEAPPEVGGMERPAQRASDLISSQGPKNNWTKEDYEQKGLWGVEKPILLMREKLHRLADVSTDALDAFFQGNLSLAEGMINDLEANLRDLEGPMSSFKQAMKELSESGRVSGKTMNR